MPTSASELTAPQRDPGAQYFQCSPDSITRTLQPSQPSTLITDVWSHALRFVDSSTVSRFAAVSLDAADLVQLECRRRRSDQLRFWRRKAAEFGLKRDAAAERRSRLSPRMREALDRQLRASINAEYVTRACVLSEFGAHVPLPSHSDGDDVNFAAISQRILDEDESQEPRLMRLAQVVLLAGPPSSSTSTVGSRRLSAFDVILSAGVDHRPRTALQLLQLLATAGFRIATSNLPYWTAFMDSFAVDRSSHEVRGSIARLAIAHDWFDLTGVMGDGSWNRFPHAILGAIPTQFLVSEMISAGIDKIRSWRPEQTRRLNRLLHEHGQSLATVLEYFQRFGHTRHLLRSILLHFPDLRRLVLVEWPQVLVHLYECHDHTTLRLLYDLDADLVGSLRVDLDGNTVLHHIVRVPNRIAARCVAMFAGHALHRRNNAGQTAADIAACLGHKLPFSKAESITGYEPLKDT